MTTKSNTLMAFTTVEDLTGTMEILVFPRVLSECREALGDNSVVVVTGRVSVKEEENAKLIANSIVPIDQYSAAPKTAAPQQMKEPRQKELWLKIPSAEGRQFAKVKNLLSLFEGRMPVFIYFEDTKQRVRCPHSLWTQEHPLLYQELERILGSGHIATK